MNLPPVERVVLTVPDSDVPDARLLGASWDHRIKSWWIARASIAGNPYVYRWMPPSDPMRAATRAEYFQRQNQRRVNAIRRSSRNRDRSG